MWEDTIKTKLRKQDELLWTELICPRLRATDPFEYGSETSGSIKYWEIIE
jgi:hypothetical protein